MEATAPVHPPLALGQQLLWLDLCVELKVPLLLDNDGVQGCQGVEKARLLPSTDGAATFPVDPAADSGLPGVLVAALAGCAQPPQLLVGAASDGCRSQTLLVHSGVQLG